ncbi:MAG: DUF1646 family protein [Elusimicrobia bacterium]|nr:DUF1646 family protein [Elusimicrobiota bacterium]
MSEILVLGGLGLVMGLVLVLPFSVRWVEEELEGFLLLMGCAAVTMSGLWSRSLAAEVLRQPAAIAAGVFVFGLAFERGRGYLYAGVLRFSAAVGMRAFLFLLVVGLR